MFLESLVVDSKGSHQMTSVFFASTQEYHLLHGLHPIMVNSIPTPLLSFFPVTPEPSLNSLNQSPVILLSSRLNWTFPHSLYCQFLWPLLQHCFTGYTHTSQCPSPLPVPHLQGSKAALQSEEVHDPSSNLSIFAPGTQCITSFNTAPFISCPLEPVSKQVSCHPFYNLFLLYLLFFFFF